MCLPARRYRGWSSPQVYKTMYDGEKSGSGGPQGATRKLVSLSQSPVFLQRSQKPVLLPALDLPPDRSWTAGRLDLRWRQR